MDTPHVMEAEGLPQHIESAKRLCRERLGQPDLRRVARAAEAAGVSAEQCIAWMGTVNESAKACLPIGRAGVEDGGATERYLLLNSACRALERLPSVPVGASVRALFCEAFENMATLSADADPGLFSVGSPRFTAACKTVSLRRFPAGEFDWEVSGIPRSWMLRVDRRDLPRMLFTIAVRLGGFAPTFVSHLGLFRKTQSMCKPENDRSFYRMAEAMTLQPDILGWSGSSWMRSPATHRVSPKLAWINETLLGNGGVVTNLGLTDPECGVLAHSDTRRKLYEAGEFRPRDGFGIWPRRPMLAWAARHPELADGLSPPPSSAPTSGIR